MISYGEEGGGGFYPMRRLPPVDPRVSESSSLLVLVVCAVLSAFLVGFALYAGAPVAALR